jgi:pimeloyl-ACP methyl ester carboxylesterase
VKFATPSPVLARARTPASARGHFRSVSEGAGTLRNMNFAQAPIANRLTQSPSRAKKARTYSEIQLHDGRGLAYAEYGDPDGYPVVYLPGLGHCHRARHPDEAVTARTGARLIVVDRPGVGWSAAKPDHTVVEYADDLAQLLDALEIDRAALLAWSAGSAFGLASAAMLPSRVSAALVVSGVVPPDVGIPLRPADPLANAMVRLARISSRLTFLPLAALRAQAQLDGDRFLRLLLASAPRSDKQVLADRPMRDMFVDSYREGSANGVAGLVTELALITKPWGFTLANVRCPVRFVYGEDDRLTPASTGTAMAELVTGSSLSVLPDAGHLLLWTYWSELLTVLVADARREDRGAEP